VFTGHVSGITFIRYAQNLKIGITFIRYVQNLKIGKPKMENIFISYISYVTVLVFGN
jgi:hypothetical protein